MADPRAAAPMRQPSPLGTWFDHHLYSLVARMGRGLPKRWAALLTSTVVALSLGLPLGRALARGNGERLARNAERSREITVCLRPEGDAARAPALAGELRARDSIAQV